MERLNEYKEFGEQADFILFVERYFRKPQENGVTKDKHYVLGRVGEWEHESGQNTVYPFFVSLCRGEQPLEIAGFERNIRVDYKEKLESDFVRSQLRGIKDSIDDLVQGKVMTKLNEQGNRIELEYVNGRGIIDMPDKVVSASKGRELFEAMRAVAGLTD